jgi:hypothetical protein
MDTAGFSAANTSCLKSLTPKAKWVMGQYSNLLLRPRTTKALSERESIKFLFLV